MTVLNFADWIASAPSWLTHLPEGLQQLFFQLYQTFVYQNRWKFFTNGLKVTFIVTIGALFLGIILGLIVAIIRTTHDTVSSNSNKKHISLNFIN